MTTSQPRRRNGQFDRMPAHAPTAASVPPATPGPTDGEEDTGGVLGHALAELQDSQPVRRFDWQKQWESWEVHALVNLLVQAAWDATDEQLAWLAGSRHTRVRAAVAHESADPQVHLVLAGDPEASVRENLAGNPHVGAEALEQLSRSRSSLCVQRVIAHPNTATATLERLATSPLAGVREPAQRRLGNLAA